MPPDQALADRLRNALKRRAGLEERRMFGDLALRFVAKLPAK